MDTPTTKKWTVISDKEVFVAALRELTGANTIILLEDTGGEAAFVEKITGLRAHAETDLAYPIRSLTDPSAIVRCLASLFPEIVLDNAEIQRLASLIAVDKYLYSQGGEQRVRVFWKAIEQRFVTTAQEKIQDEQSLIDSGLQTFNSEYAIFNAMLETTIEVCYRIRLLKPDIPTRSYLDSIIENIYGFTGATDNITRGNAYDSILERSKKLLGLIDSSMISDQRLFIEVAQLLTCLTRVDDIGNLIIAHKFPEPLVTKLSQTALAWSRLDYYANDFFKTLSILFKIAVLTHRETFPPDAAFDVYLRTALDEQIPSELLAPIDIGLYLRVPHDNIVQLLELLADETLNRLVWINPLATPETPSPMQNNALIVYRKPAVHHEAFAHAVIHQWKELSSPVVVFGAEKWFDADNLPDKLLTEHGHVILVADSLAKSLPMPS